MGLGYAAFVIDTKTQLTQAVSLSNSGVEATNNSAVYDISENGRFALFCSEDDSLVPGDNNGFDDVFVRDLRLGTTERISAERPGLPTGRCFARKRALAPRGTPRHVLFNCQGPDPFGPQYESTFMYDRKTKHTELISVDEFGNQLSGIGRPLMSANGRYLVFSSFLTLSPKDTDQTLDVYVRDMKTQKTRLAVVGVNGALPDGYVELLDMTPDARYLVVNSTASNLDEVGNPDHSFQLYRYDRLRRKAERLTITIDGTSPNGQPLTASISDAGNKIVFDSHATNLVANDGNGTSDIFMRTLKRHGRGQ